MALYMRRVIKGILITIAVTAAVLALMQLVPYGRDHGNPPVVVEPKWDQPATRALAVRACFDCHSNQTDWPAYSHVAPFSWVVQRNVRTARTVLNFSDWSRRYELMPQAPASVLAREMPPRIYLLMHPEARLTDAEKLQLARGLQATFGLPRRN
jgi:Haem-binding domain